MKISKSMSLGSIAFLMSLLIGGCASDANKKLDQRLAVEPVITNGAALNQEAQVLIEQDPNLTPEQKTKLAKLRDETSAELKRLGRESLQLKDLLIKDFIAENDLEIDTIRGRLKKLNDRQVSAIFDSIKKADKIIGHIPRDREWINKMFVDDRARF